MMEKRKKIIIYGAGGFIGKKICSLLQKTKYEVVAFDLFEGQEGNIKINKLDLLQDNLYDKKLENPYAVINLTGESIFGYWSKSKKEKIMKSRVLAGERLAKQWSNDDFCPKVYLGASAIGFYGNTKNILVDEFAKKGDGFLSEVVEKLEKSIVSENLKKVRVVYIRTGIVIGLSGGIMKKILPLYRFCLGGPIAGGKFFFPWVSLDDIALIYLFCLENLAIKGPVNAVAPQLVTYREFSNIIAEQLNYFKGFSWPLIFLKLRFGQLASEITSSIKVYPGVLISHNYEFKYPRLEQYLSTFAKSKKTL